MPLLSPTPTLPILAATLTGALTTLFRLSLVLACAELESCGVGMAGFICNVVNAGLIPTTALLSLAIFGEVLGPMEVVGAVVVFGAILVLTAAKFWKAASSNRSSTMKEGGREELDVEEEMKLIKD